MPPGLSSSGILLRPLEALTSGLEYKGTIMGTI